MWTSWSSRFPNVSKMSSAVFTNFICVAFFALLSWRNIYQAGILHKAQSVSASLSIPESPFVLVLGIGFGVAALVFLLQFIESIGKAIGKWTP